MLFKRPGFWKEEKEKVVNKCDFCKSRDAIGKVNGFRYCSESICRDKFWKRINRLEDNKSKEKEECEKKALKRYIGSKKRKIIRTYDKV